MLVRNLDESSIAGLKARALQRGTSAEEEARRLIRDGLALDKDAILARLDAVRRFNGPQPATPSTIDLIREDRARDDNA